MQIESLPLNDKYFIRCQEQKNLNSGIRFHNGYEFLFVRRGSVDLFANGGTATIKSGAGVLLPPGAVHSYKTADSSESYICVFSGRFIPGLNRIRKISDPEVRPFEVPYGEELIDLLKNASDEFMQKGILYVFASMASCFPDKESKNSGSLDAADRIMEYMEKNYLYDITLSDAAKELNYHYNYLSKLINKIFKTSFSGLLNKYRIYAAQRAFLDSNDAITNVAGQCGYSSLRSFNRNFKKITGRTPTEYLEEIGEA